MEKSRNLSGQGKSGKGQGNIFFCKSLGKVRENEKFVPPCRCNIFRLKCIKFVFRWGYAPDPAGELTALPETPWLHLILLHK